jgi:hypothetical protein
MISVRELLSHIGSGLLQIPEIIGPKAEHLSAKLKWWQVNMKKLWIESEKGMKFRWRFFNKYSRKTGKK